WPTSSSAQRTRVSRARPLPPSGERSNAVMTMVIVLLVSGWGPKHRTGPREQPEPWSGDCPEAPTTIDRIAIQRMDRLGIVVYDLAAATAFFLELGLSLQ